MKAGGMRIPHTRGSGLALAFVAACISGIAIFVNAEYVGQVEDATVYTTGKNAVAAALLLTALLLGSARKARPRRATLAPRQRLGLIALGVIGGSIPFVLFFEGLARAESPVQAGFIHKTLIVWVALLAVPLLHERLTALHVGAIALLLVGQASLVDGLGSLRFDAGGIMVLIATLLWSIEFVLAKHLLGSLPTPVVAAARLGIGVVFLGAYVLVTGRADEFAGLTGEQWLWMVVTGVILAAFVATWFGALSRAQAVDVTAVLVFGQIVTSALTSATNGVSIRADLLGLGLILAGVIAVAGATLRSRDAIPGTT
jgi:drug/metabolite transporter (DMT)-like permease